MKILSILFILFIYCCFTHGDEDSKRPSTNISCNHDDHCGDFRMVCCAKSQLCICSRFYDWDEELQQCHLNLSELGLWMSNLKEERDLKGELTEEANAVFSQLAFAGLFAIFCGLFGGLLCVYCFCCNPSEGYPPDDGPLISKQEEQRKKNIESGDAGMIDTMVLA